MTDPSTTSGAGSLDPRPLLRAQGIEFTEADADQLSDHLLKDLERRLDESILLLASPAERSGYESAVATGTVEIQARWVSKLVPDFGNLVPQLIHGMAEDLRLYLRSRTPGTSLATLNVTTSRWKSDQFGAQDPLERALLLRGFSVPGTPRWVSVPQASASIKAAATSALDAEELAALSPDDRAVVEAMDAAIAAGLMPPERRTGWFIDRFPDRGTRYRELVRHCLADLAAETTGVTATQPASALWITASPTEPGTAQSGASAPDTGPSTV